MSKVKSPGFYEPMGIAPGEYVTCPDCKGKRIVSSGRPNMRDGHICFTCGGTGTILAMTNYSDTMNKTKDTSNDELDKILSNLIPHGFSKMTLQEAKQAISDYCNGREVEAIKKFCKDKVVISSFKCGKHGNLGAIDIGAECLKCLSEGTAPITKKEGLE